ncbi:ATP-binding cassette domain-containing protein, partial [Bacillus paralicheniformis]|uniref:ATP-binding cassette domain-containing protein n=1 Tax=Bacillus paralicheniformis TaxID=1648923 RepID=UPI002282E209
AFEFPNFYQRLTALENLNLFRSLYASETEEPETLLALTGLEEYGRTKVSAYSKGMKMRLNFLRALINQPDLLFLDEPTSGLDPVHAA